MTSHYTDITLYITLYYIRLAADFIVCYVPKSPVNWFLFPDDRSSIVSANDSNMYDTAEQKYDDLTDITAGEENYEGVADESREDNKYASLSNRKTIMAPWVLSSSLEHRIPVIYFPLNVIMCMIILPICSHIFMWCQFGGRLLQSPSLEHKLLWKMNIFAQFVSRAELFRAAQLWNGGIIENSKIGTFLSIFSNRLFKQRFPTCGSRPHQGSPDDFPGVAWDIPKMGNKL